MIMYVYSPDESDALAMLSCLIYRGLLKGHPPGVIHQFWNGSNDKTTKGQIGTMFYLKCKGVAYGN